LEALAVFSKASHAFDLVISDMTMPKMTGDKMAQEFLKVRPDLPIVLCTGFSKKISPEKAAAIGVKEVMTKPVAVEKMAHVVRSVLDSAH
jgi:DNA-binding NtrC family response regulator